MGQRKGKMSAAEISDYVDIILTKSQNRQLAELVRADLESGLSREDTELYSLRRGITFPQMKLVSEALHKGADGRMLLDKFFREQADYGRLAVALKFWDSGIPADRLAEGISKCATAHDLKTFYEKTLEELQEMQTLKEDVFGSETGDDTAASDKMQRLEELASSAVRRMEELREQFTRYESLSEVLDAAISDANAGLRAEELAYRLCDLEAENSRLEAENASNQAVMEDQQEKINDSLRAAADYRHRIEELQEENRRLAEDQLEKSPDEQPNHGEQNFGEQNRKEQTPGKQIPDSGRSRYTEPDKRTDTEDRKEAYPHMEEKAEEIPVSCTVTYRGRDGKVQAAQLEPMQRNERGRTSILAAFLFRRKSKRDIMRLVADGRFSPEQLEQVQMALEAGLTEEQMQLLVNPELSIGQMQGLIRIGACQNSIRRERGEQ